VVFLLPWANAGKVALPEGTYSIRALDQAGADSGAA